MWAARWDAIAGIRQRSEGLRHGHCISPDMQPTHALLLGFALLTTACLDDGAPRGPRDLKKTATKTTTADRCDGPIDVDVTNLQRLTPPELRAAWHDLTGDDGADLALDDDTGRALTELGTQHISEGAFELAERAVANNELFGCDAHGARDDACAARFIESFGAHAFRGPLSDDDSAWLTQVYVDAADASDFAGGLTVLTAVILQAPQLLYLAAGPADVDSDLAAGVRRLDGSERATRLALFLTGRPADADLLAAGARGDLDTAAGVAAAADALLQTPAAHDVVRSFFVDLLHLDGGQNQPSLADNPKDTALFANDNPALREAMRTEMLALVDHLVFDGDQSWPKLWTSTEAYVNAPLAALYGVDVDDPASSAFFWTTLPAQERAGLLTRAGFLTLYAGRTVPSPIRRGVFVLKGAFCIELGDPPPNASDTPVVGGVVDGEHRSVRDDVTVRTQNEPCIGCHSMINPAGFAFQNYDALGQFQTREHGVDDDGTPYELPIDASGELVFSDQAGPVDDATELSQRIADSADARRCFVERWMTRALRRPLGSADSCAVDQVVASFAESNDVRALLLAIVRSDAFLHVRPAADAAVVDEEAAGEEVPVDVAVFVQSIEAEDAALEAPMVAAGGSVSTPVAEEGAARFTFTVPVDGGYVLAATATADDTTHNSFYVTLDDDAVVRDGSHAFDVVPGDTGVVDVGVRGDGPADVRPVPITWSLSAGVHVFTFWGREAATRLDVVTLRGVQ